MQSAVEGVSLLKVLSGRRIAENARRARTAALIKFAVLVLALGYAAARTLKRQRNGAFSVVGSVFQRMSPPLRHWHSRLLIDSNPRAWGEESSDFR